MAAGSGTHPIGSIEQALAHAERLLGGRPEMALAQAREILRVAPADPRALLMAGRAERAAGHPIEAHATLARLAAQQPRSAYAAYMLGLAARDLRRPDEAAGHFRKAVMIDHAHLPAWSALADVLRLKGDDKGAADASMAMVRASVDDPVLTRAALALGENALPEAEADLRGYLRGTPDNVAAIRMLAEVAARLGRFDDAERLLARALDLAPGFDAARQARAMVLQRANRPIEALAEIDRLLAADPTQAGWRTVKAAILVRMGDYAGAIALYEGLLDEFPGLARTWMSYGHARKTLGDHDQAVTAYRRATALQPTLGEAWWSLANLKTHRFDDAATTAMEAALGTPQLDDEDRLHLHFALGKAREDAREDAAAFRHYVAGNALRRGQLGYEPERIATQVDRTIAMLDAPFFAARSGQGCPAPDPIFVLGLPRAGSTLVEQILASHPQVEGTMELPDLMAIARGIEDYPAGLGALPPERLRALGEEYLERTRVQRHTDLPFFVDKMPNNWLHVGLIAAILPNARIIDARRHPMDCCFSAFRQHFARGQAFSYGLDDLGRYYRDYLRLMAHVDRVLPGRVHRVIHERLIEDTEGQVRALLAACGLPFDPACLAFWETQRAVRTASSEQVRRPVNREGVDRWQRFARELTPLRDALGSALCEWDVPA